jgi:DNA-binding PadR family transcriptional regulator
MPVTTSLKPAVFHILLALSGRDLHGLGIADAVEQATDGSVLLGPGTLYRSLKEMTQRGLISETEAPEGEADPRRRFYRITEEGRVAVAEEATRMERLVEVARSHRVLPERP